MRIVAAMLLLAVLAISTGTVLLLGYVLAAFSGGVIVFVMGRKMTRRIANARYSRLRLVTRSTAHASGTTREEERPAA